MYGTQFAQIIPPRALDSNQSHFLHHLAGSDLSANRDLTWVTGDADRQAILQGDPTLDDWFDQGVKSSDSPTFAGLTLGALDGVLHAAAGVVSGSAGLADLADIDIAGAASGDLLQFDGADWIDFDLFAAANTWTAANTFTGSANPLVIGSGAAGVDYQLKFDGENNDGLLVWKEDEDYFSFADDVLMELDLCFALTTYKIRKEPSNATLACEVLSGADFKWYINSVEEMQLDDDGYLHVDQVFCTGVIVRGDMGMDVLGHVVFTDVMAIVGSGSTAALGATGGKAAGPATAAQWGWRKEYEGLSVNWVPIWR